MSQPTKEIGAEASTAVGGRQRWIEAAKGIGILIVVCYHVVGSYRFDGASADLLDVNVNWDTRLRNSMPVFFFISGLLAMRTLRRPGGTFWRYLVERLLYPYVLWSAISVAASSSFSGANRNLRPFNLLLIGWRPVLQYWYLMALIVYLVVCRLLLRFDTTLRSLLVALGLAWLALLVGVGVDGYFSRQLELHFGFFCLGVLAGPPLVGALERRRTGFLVGMALAGLAAIVVIVRPSMSWPSWHILPAFAGLVPLFTILALAFLVARHRPGSWLEYVGARSLEIYVVHVIVAAATRVVLFRLGVSSIPVHMVVALLLATLVPLALEAVVVRYGLPSPFRLSLRRLGPSRRQPGRLPVEAEGRPGLNAAAVTRPPRRAPRLSIRRGASR